MHWVAGSKLLPRGPSKMKSRGPSSTSSPNVENSRVVAEEPQRRLYWQAVQEARHRPAHRRPHAGMKQQREAASAPP